MIVHKDGSVTGSIDRSRLAELQKDATSDEAKAQLEQLHSEAEAAETEAAEAAEASGLTETELEADQQAAEARESQPEEREDGVHSVGGGWHEVVVDGAVVDKVRGADAAQEAYRLRGGSQTEQGEVNDGNDQLP